MDRSRKEQVVEELGRIFEESSLVVVSRYEGLTVVEMTAFRHAMRAAGGGVRVAKNRLAKIALQGSDSEGLSSLLSGMNALAFGDDPVAVAKAVEAFAKENEKLEIVGGALGREIVDRAGVAAVSKMPSREETLAAIAATLGAPAAGLAGALGEPASGLAAALGAQGAAISGIVAAQEARAAAA